MACYDFLSIFVVFGGPTGLPGGLKKEKRNKKEKEAYRATYILYRVMPAKEKTDSRVGKSKVFFAPIRLFENIFE
jgi:hypothetical protein